MREIPIRRKRSRLSRGVRQAHVLPYDYLLLGLLALVWGGSFMLQKIAVAEVPAVTMTAMRQLVGAVFMGALLVLAGNRLHANLREHFLMVLSAILGTVLPFSLIATGIETIDSGLAAILMGAMPLVTIVLAHYVTHDEKLNRHKVVAVGLGIAGLVVLFWPALAGGIGQDAVAQLLVLGAAVCYALNSLVTKKLVHLDAPGLLGIIIFWSVLMLVPMALILEPGAFVLPSLETSLSIIGLGLGPTAIAAFLMYELIGRQGAGFFGQINLLVPATGVFMGFVFLGERLAWNAWVALAIILAGVFVSRNWNSAKTAAKDSSQTATQGNPK